MYPNLFAPPKLYSDSVVELEMASPLSLYLPLMFSKKELLESPRIPTNKQS